MTRISPSKVFWIQWILVFAMGFSLLACSSPEQRAQAHYQSGESLFKSGEYVKAGLEYRNALKYNEKLAGAWFGLANVSEKTLDWSTLNDSLLHVVELDPKNFEALVKLSKLQLAAVQLDPALKNINAANDLKNNDTNVLAVRAAILFRIGDREGARADAEHALAINHDNPDALAVLAADQIMNKNIPSALLFIERGLSKFPDNLGLLLFEVKIFDETHDDVKLEAVLRKIVATDPANKDYRRGLLNFLISRNRLPDVETEIRAMLATNPDDVELALNLVRVVNTLKGAQAARQELEALIAAKPATMDFQFALAQLDFTEQHTDIAVSALSAIISKGEPKDSILRARLILAAMQTKLGHTKEAKALIDDVLASDAKNSDALAMRANFRIESGDEDNAIADLREALNQQPNSVPFLTLLAKALERQGAVDLANDRWMEAVKASKYDPQVTLNYIDVLGRRGKTDQIEPLLSDALARNPSNPGLLTALAQSRLAKHDWVGAQAAADALKKAGDVSGVSQEIIGALQGGQKKYAESIATLKEAYAATPQTTRPLYSLVRTYVQAGQIAEAETFLRSILTANAKNADALVLTGSIKELQKKPEEAEAAYKQSIDDQPDNPAGYIALSKLYLSQGKIPEAEALLQQGRQKLPSNLEINLSLAGVLEMKNDIEGAISLYEEQLRLYPDVPIIINNLASLLAEYRTDAASLSRSLQLSKRLAAIDVPQFMDTMGWVAYRNGDYRAALTNLETASEKLPDMALVKYHLAMTYMALKRKPDAKTEFTKALSLLKDSDPLHEKIRVAMASLGTGD